jgi:hypothetical protein
LQLRQDLLVNPEVVGRQTTFHLVFLPFEEHRFFDETGIFAPDGTGGHEWTILSKVWGKAVYGPEKCSLPAILRTALEQAAMADKGTIRYHAYNDPMVSPGRNMCAGPVVDIALKVPCICDARNYAKNLVRKLDRWAWREELRINGIDD